MSLKTDSRILITGASGLLGWKALQVLGTDFPVLGLYNQHPVEILSPQLRKCDLTDANELIAACDSFRPTHILHCAAFTEIDAAETERDLCHALNVGVVKSLVEYCESNAALLTHISTDAFFTLAADQLATERTEANPISYYGETKLAGEQIIQESGIDFQIVRTNIYGWNLQPKRCLAEWILEGLLLQEQRKLFTDVTFTPILTNRLVRCLRSLMFSSERGLFHIAGQNNVSKHEFGLAIARVFGLNASTIEESNLAEVALTAKRSSHMGLDSQKFFDLFPEQVVSLEQDLIEFRNEMIYKDPRWIANRELGRIRFQYTV